MKNSVVLLLMLVAIGSVAQNSRTYISNRYALERMGTIGVGSNSVPGQMAAEPETIGDAYSKPNFATMTALLYNDQTLSGVLAKYDILHDDFYFQTKQGLRVMPGSQVKSFTFVDSLTKKESQYINAKEIKSPEGTPYSGFFEILYDGRMALLRKYEVTIQKANYNIALNVGRRDHLVSKKIELYYLYEDVATKMPELRGTSKIFGDLKTTVDKFIKINQLNLKDERHMILVFEHANQKMEATN